MEAYLNLHYQVFLIENEEIFKTSLMNSYLYNIL